MQELCGAEITPGLTDADDIPEPPDTAVTQPGDLWLLGEHRLYCGDASKPEEVDRLLAGAPVHVTTTDPPYTTCALSHEAVVSTFLGEYLCNGTLWGLGSIVGVGAEAQQRAIWERSVTRC